MISQFNVNCQYFKEIGIELTLIKLLYMHYDEYPLRF